MTNNEIFIACSIGHIVIAIVLCRMHYRGKKFLYDRDKKTIDDALRYRMLNDKIN